MKKTPLTTKRPQRMSRKALAHNLLQAVECDAEMTALAQLAAEFGQGSQSPKGLLGTLSDEAVRFTACRSVEDGNGLMLAEGLHGTDDLLSALGRELSLPTLAQLEMYRRKLVRNSREMPEGVMTLDLALSVLLLCQTREVPTHLDSTAEAMQSAMSEAVASAKARLQAQLNVEF